MTKRVNQRSVHRRRGITIAAAAVAVAVGVQGLPAVGYQTTPVAQAAEWPGADAWAEANMVQADNLANGKNVRGVGDLNEDRGSVWGFAQFADRGTMEGDDAWAPWRDTHIPAGVPVYMRYTKQDGSLSRIHTAVTHQVTWSNMTVYSFKFQDGQPRLRPSGNSGDFASSADVQIMIGQNNSVMNPSVGEPMSVIRATPGGNYHGGVAADSDLMRLTIDSSWGDNDRTWRSTMLKFYQVSPAATKLKSRLSETADKSIKRTYSGMVWNDTMNARGGENNWNNNYNNSVDRGVKKDAVDQPAVGHTVYQAVPNEAAYHALGQIRYTTNPDSNYRNNPQNLRDRQTRIAEYVRNNPQNFTVYKAEVRADGTYTLNSSFDSAKHADYIYMWVEDENGIKTNMSAWTTPEFRAPYGTDRLTESGHSFTLKESSYNNGHVPYQNHLVTNQNDQDPLAPRRDSAGNWTNVHFALVTNADGSSHTVTPSTPDPGKDADTYNPGYQGVEVLPGESVVSQPPKDKDGKPLPPDTEFTPGEHTFPGEISVDPETGEVTVKPRPDATPGDYTIPVTVTYPDGTSEVIDLDVTVKTPTVPDTPDKDTYQPIYDPQSGKPGVEKPVNQRVGDIPEGTKFEPSLPDGWTAKPNPNGGVGDMLVTPGTDAKPGTYVIPVQVTYPDGTQEFVSFTYTVEPEDNVDNDPRYPEDSKVPQGGEVTIESPKNPDGSPLPPNTEYTPGEIDFPGEVTVDPETGEVTVKPRPDAPIGDYTIPVTITYPDGSTDKVDVPVEVTEGDTDKDVDTFEPGYGTTEGTAGKTTPVKQTGDKVPDGTKITLPAPPTGWTFGEPDAQGNFDVTPDKDALPGTRVTIPVRFTYPDGTSETKDAIFIVRNDSAANDPDYEDTIAPPGEETIIDPPKNPDDSPLPPDATFEEGDNDFPGTVEVDPGTGEIVVDPNEGATPGDYTIPVIITYPDGTEDEIDVVITIPEETPDTPTDPIAGDIEPAYGDYSGLPGKATTIEQTGDKIPEGTKVILPNPPAGWQFGEPDANGNYTVTPPADVAPGTKITMPVQFFYPDSSLDRAVATFTVTNDAYKNDPAYGPREVAPREEATTVPAPKNSDNSPLPEGTQFAQDPETKVTGPDGTDLDSFPGTIEVDPNTGAVTVTPNADAPTGNYNIPVEVSYPDGSTETIWAGVFIPEAEETPTTPIADDINPAYGEYHGKIGEAIPVEQTGDSLPEGTRVVLPNMPAGWELGEPDANGNFTATAPEGTLPGTTVTLPVRFVYPDGSIDDATAKVTVTDDAYDNDPSYGDRTVTPPGEDTHIDPPKNSDGSPLPDGTTFKPGTEEFPGTFDVDPDTGAVTINPDTNVVPGDYDLPVVVTYPDGSTETITVPIHIPKDEPTDPSGPTDAESNNPSYPESSGKAGEVSTITQDGDRELPEGTKFILPKSPAGWEFGTPDANGDFTVKPPADATPGTRVTIPVLVEYPDGSYDRTTAVFTVIGDDAHNNDPIYEDAEAPKGEDTTIESPKNPDGSDLPKDTTYEEGENDFPGKVEVDPGTGQIVVRPNDDATPGDYTIPVEVTYPDGSKDITDVTVTIPEDPTGGDDGNDAQENNPGYQNQSGPAGKPTKFEQSGDRDLPNGTKFIFPSVPSGWTLTGDEKTGDFTITAPANTPDGSKITIPIVAVYPDGTTDAMNPVYTVNNGEPGDSGDKDTDNNDPSYPKDPIVTPKEEDTTIESPKNPDGSTVPDGTEFTPGPGVDQFPGDITIDPGTGEIVVNPGKDARPGDYKIPVIVTYPDGSQDVIDVTVRVPMDPVIVKPGDQVIVTPGDGGTTPGDVVIKDPDGNVIKPGDLGIIIETGPDGKIVITFPEDLKPGDYSIEFTPGKEPIKVEIIRDGKPIDFGDIGGSSGGSSGDATGGSSNPKCIAGLLGVGIPLLLLVPVGIAATVNIPGLEQFRAQASKAMQDANTIIQKNLGIFDSQMAGASSGMRFPGRELATIGGGLALTALGLLIADQIAKNCAPGYDGLSSLVGGQDGSSGTADGSSGAASGSGDAGSASGGSSAS